MQKSTELVEALLIKIRTKVVLSFVYKYGVIVHSGGRVANLLL